MCKRSCAHEQTFISTHRLLPRSLGNIFSQPSLGTSRVQSGGWNCLAQPPPFLPRSPLCERQERVFAIRSCRLHPPHIVARPCGGVILPSLSYCDTASSPRAHLVKRCFVRALQPLTLSLLLHSTALDARLWWTPMAVLCLHKHSIRFLTTHSPLLDLLGMIF
jgi:hypothetical protein